MKRESITEGLRPTIPPNIDNAYETLLKQCWDTSPRNRPDFTTIVIELSSQRDSKMGEDSSSSTFGSFFSVSSVPRHKQLSSHSSILPDPPPFRSLNRQSNMLTKVKLGTKHTLGKFSGNVLQTKVSVCVSLFCIVFLKYGCPLFVVLIFPFLFGL